MEKIENVFKIFDIYCDYFYFRIGNENKYKTSLGGILSMLTLGIFIFIIYEFGQIFLFKLNPSTTTEIEFYNPSEGFLTGDKYSDTLMIFGVDSTLQDYVNFTITNFIQTDPLTKVKLKSKASRCTLTDLSKNSSDYSYINTSSSDSTITFFCVKMNNFSLSPISLYGITSREAYVRVNMILNNPDNQTLPDTLNFFYLYNKLGYTPNNYDNPFKRKLDIYTKKINIDTTNTFNFFYDKITLNDDNGWVLKSNYLRDEISYNSAVESVNIPSNLFNNYFLSFKVALTDSHTTFTRTFIKVQDLLAQIGGFMKAIFLMLNSVIYFIRIYKIDLFIMSKFFRYGKKSLLKNKKEENKILNCSNVMLNNYLEKEKTEVKNDKILDKQMKWETPLKDIQTNNYDKFKSEEKELKINNETVIELEKVNQFQSNLFIKQNFENENKRIDKINNIETVSDLTENQNINNCYSYFKNFYYNLIDKEDINVNNSSKEFLCMRKALKMCNQFRDVDYIIEKIHENEILKRILLNDEQILTLGLIKRPEISVDVDEEDIMIKYYDLQNLDLKSRENIIVNYYFKIFDKSRSSVSSIDNNLYNMLPIEIKEQVKNKSNEMDVTENKIVN